MAKINKMKMHCTCDCGAEFTAHIDSTIDCPFCMRKYFVRNLGETFFDLIDFKLDEVTLYTKEGEPIDDI